MSPLNLPVPIYPGKRYVALLRPEGPRVEAYRGANADGSLSPRGDLVGLRSTTHFAWGCDCDGTLVLAASILADALGRCGIDDHRAARLAPFFAAEILGNYRPFAPFVILYSKIEDWIASVEDQLEGTEEDV